MNADIDKIYVTGAAGMIGSNLSVALLKEGYSVVGIDNFWRGTRNNIAHLEGNKNFSFRHADIISDHDWYRDMTAKSAIIHTSDIVAGIGYVFSNEWAIFQKNVLINTQIARVASHKTPRRLIYFGTACSYPQKLQRSVEESVLREDMKYPADPESGYGWSKLIGEIEFGLMAKGAPVQITTLDLHNVYGWPCVFNDSTSQVIPSLIYKALKSTDRKLIVWGNGEQGRAFVHVSDVVSAVIATLSYNGTETSIMIGPDRCTKISEVAKIIKNHPRIKLDEIVYDTSKPTGDIGRFANASLAKKELSWEATVPFTVGLNSLIDDIINHSSRAI